MFSSVVRYSTFGGSDGVRYECVVKCYQGLCDVFTGSGSDQYEGIFCVGDFHSVLMHPLVQSVIVFL